MNEEIDALVLAGLTAKGTRLLSKDNLLALFSELLDRQLIISNVEAFDDLGEFRRARMESSLTFVDDRSEIDWSAKVIASVRYARDITDDAPAETKFRVWLQEDESV